MPVKLEDYKYGKSPPQAQRILTGSLTWLLLAGRTFTSGKKGFNGKGRGTIYFGYSHSDAYSEFSV
jgi:hypothetical protein